MVKNWSCDGYRQVTRNGVDVVCAVVWWWSGEGGEEVTGFFVLLKRFYCKKNKTEKNEQSIFLCTYTDLGQDVDDYLCHDSQAFPPDDIFVYPIRTSVFKFLTIDACVTISCR